MANIPVKVEKIAYHSPTHSYAILLREQNGDRKLPVIVGAFEAQAIALAFENVSTPRPMVHDLVGNIIQEIDAQLVSVIINDLKDGVYYANLELESQQYGSHQVDARPSDAIAIALRLSAEIMISETVLDKADVSEKEIARVIKSKDSSAIEPSRTKLESDLDRAISEEEYEIAAQLRDKIKELYPG